MISLRYAWLTKSIDDYYWILRALGNRCNEFKRGIRVYHFHVFDLRKIFLVHLHKYIDFQSDMNLLDLLDIYRDDFTWVRDITRLDVGFAFGVDMLEVVNEPWKNSKFKIRDHSLIKYCGRKMGVG